MQFKYIFFLIVLAIGGCSKQDPKLQKEHLAGYWEISSVEMTDGTKKSFSINSVVDFIEVTGDYGVRTKVAPKFDGTFVTNGTAEKFSIKIEDDSLRLYYETPFDNWKETILTATDSILTVKNRDNKIYYYSRFKKFNFGE